MIVNALRTRLVAPFGVQQHCEQVSVVLEKRTNDVGSRLEAPHAAYWADFREEHAKEVSGGARSGWSKRRNSQSAR